MFHFHKNTRIVDTSYPKQSQRSRTVFITDLNCLFEAGDGEGVEEGGQLRENTRTLSKEIRYKGLVKYIISDNDKFL